MYISRIQENYPTNLQKVKKSENFRYVSLQNLPADEFVKITPTKNISFSGRTNIIERLMQKYLENKSYKNSILGSKRPYLPLSEDLKPFTKEFKIKLPNNEEISVLDINRTNSQNYILFLHGFSQNIHDNQQLYKEISKSRFGILVPEYRGYGKNIPTKNYTENNIVEDINYALNYLKENNKTCEGIIGHSFGAYIGTRISKVTNPKFLVIASPMVSLEFWLKKVVKHPKRYKFEYGLIKYIKNFNKQYHKVFDINKYIIGNDTNTYIVQSTNDAYVRTCKVCEIANNIKNLKKFVKVRNGGHKMESGKINEIKKIIDKL